MLLVKCINNSPAVEQQVRSFLDTLKERLDNVDFSKFGINDYTIHVVINADPNSVKMASSLPIDNRFVYYQGIPKEYAYNSNFEAKLSVIRLRVQNINIPFEKEIENIIFVIDFRKDVITTENASPEIISAEKSTLADKIMDKAKNLFAPKDDTDEEGKRKASFVPVKPKFSIDSIIMTEEMSEQIEDALSIIRNRKIIYEDWGFKEVDPQPKAILSFWGPPGTGKTMCAHGIASAMNQKILAVNYAEIESKYAGESPKNLIAAFNAAQENNAILFFDEADSFLGKRISNVQSGHDQSINSLRSQMLIQLEDFEGIVIFATNLVKNFDPAFETRILRHIKFDLPDEAARVQIYKTLIPSKLPTEKPITNDDLLILSQKSVGFSGRDIRNSILDTLANAAKKGLKSVPIDLFIDAINKRQDSYSKIKEEKNQENKSIAEDIKNSIIAKSNQEFNEALISIALYAAWSDNNMDSAEEGLIRELSKALNVELHTDVDKNYLPPLSQVVEYFNTEEKKLKAIDMAVRIVAIDGQFVDKEIAFVSDLCDRLRFSVETKKKIMDYTSLLATVNQNWNGIKDVL